MGLFGSFHQPGRVVAAALCSAYSNNEVSPILLISRHAVFQDMWL